MEAFLTQITKWITSQGPKQETRSMPWAWVAGLAIAAVAAITVSIAYWKQRKIGKELAKLKHERDVRLRIKEDLDTITRTIRSATKAALLRKEAAKNILEITKFDALITQSEELAIRKQNEIDNLKNWRDVDRFLSEPRDDSSSGTSDRN